MRNKEGGAGSIFNILLILGMFAIILIVVAAAYVGAKEGARDSQRAVDIDRITQALKNYQTDNNRFPDAAQNQPVGLNQYLDRWPAAPEPADGSCAKEQNRYSYQTFNGGSSYILSFCLGSKTGRYGSGPQTIKVP
ncbi:MAG: hypothetical protein ACM3NH_04210 [Candidatus Saccharibacteria bacterium]